MTKQTHSLLILALAISAITAARANAALIGSPAYSSDVPGSYIAGGYSIGFEFEPTINITVTALGYVDYLHDGLAESHEVAIFSTDGNQVPGAMVTVLPADSAGGAADIGDVNVWFAYHELPSPVTLLAGITYRIAGRSSEFDALNYHAPITNHTNAPFITTGRGVYVNDATPDIEYPATPDAANFYSTPNFLYTVPEPASLGTLALGATALLARRRHRA